MGSGKEMQRFCVVPCQGLTLHFPNKIIVHPSLLIPIIDYFLSIEYILVENEKFLETRTKLSQD